MTNQTTTHPETLKMFSVVSAIFLAATTAAWSLIYWLIESDNSNAGNSRKETVLTLALVVSIVVAILAVLTLVSSFRLSILTYFTGILGIASGVLGSRADNFIAELVGYLVAISAIALISSQFLRKS